MTDPSSCVFDSGLTKVVGDQVKIVGGGLDVVTGAPLPASALMFVCPAVAAALLPRC